MTRELHHALARAFRAACPRGSARLEHARPRLDPRSSPSPRHPWATPELRFSPAPSGADPFPTDGEPTTLPSDPWSGASPADPPPPSLFRGVGFYASLEFLAQVRATFLVCAGSDGLYVLDQHAAAERVTFHRLRTAFASRAVQMQRLLIPEVVELVSAEIATIEENAEEIAALGVELRAVGPNAVAVHGVPTLVESASPQSGSSATSPPSSDATRSARLVTLPIWSSRRWRATGAYARATCCPGRRRWPFSARSTRSTSRGTARTAGPWSPGSPSTSSSDVSAVERALGLLRDEDDLVAIVGPTASGKTALAAALAAKLGGEVVGADSVQIYRAFDVGSGKPTVEEQARAPHHLVSALDPLDPMDAGRSWARLASERIAEVRARGRVPIVCGGTFLWIKALLYGLAGAPAASEEVRARHRAIEEAEGRQALHARLKEVDPAAAARLHPNDLVRTSRALEVFELSGKTLSAWQEEHAFRQVLHRARLFAIGVDAEVLTQRIRTRCAAWLAGGWVEEVEALLARGYGEARAMGSVGYAEVRAGCLPAGIARADLETAIVRATRVFARRQRTWLNHAAVDWL